MNALVMFVAVFAAVLCAQVLAPFVVSKVNRLIDNRKAKSITSEFYKKR